MSLDEVTKHEKVETRKLNQRIRKDPDHETVVIESAEAWGDINGETLSAEAVRKARREEIAYIRRKKVWTKIPRAKALKMGWKVIKVRWIDVNKGDKNNPMIRCRLVGKEFNDGEEEGLFAATPPLEALKLIVSDAASGDPGRKSIMINDVARAFFEAPTRRVVCV